MNTPSAPHHRQGRRLRAWRELISPATFALAVLAFTLLASSGVRASTLLVDGFEAPSTPVSNVFTSVNETTLNQFSPSVLGGVRGLYHHTYTNPLGSVAALAAGNGVLSTSNGVGVQTEVLAMYGAFTRPTLDPQVGGPLLRLNATPYNAFQLDFTGMSSAMNINIVLYTSAPVDPAAPLYYSSVGVNVAPPASGAPLQVVMPFRNDPNFNFGQVDGIALVIDRANGATGVAWTLDSFSLVSAVPEPSPAALWLAGGAVLAWMGRRQRARPGPGAAVQP